MADSSEHIIASQAASIAELKDQLAVLQARLGPDPNAKPDPAGSRFPAMVYRRQSPLKKGQVDHPGVDARKVIDQHDLDAALADGWSSHCPPLLYEEPAEPEPAKKAGKK